MAENDILINLIESYAQIGITKYDFRDYEKSCKAMIRIFNVILEEIENFRD